MPCAWRTRCSAFKLPERLAQAGCTVNRYVSRAACHAGDPLNTAEPVLRLGRHYSFHRDVAGRPAPPHGPAALALTRALPASTRKQQRGPGLNGADTCQPAASSSEHGDQDRRARPRLLGFGSRCPAQAWAEPRSWALARPVASPGQAPAARRWYCSVAIPPHTRPGKLCTKHLPSGSGLRIGHAHLTLAA